MAGSSCVGAAVANAFRRNRRGFREVLNRGETSAAVNLLAERVAANARTRVPDDVDITVDHYRTDRGAASVAIADPEGLALQAKGGVLTRAAASAGLEVKSR